MKTIIQFRSPSVTPSVKRDKQTNDELGNVPTRDSGTGRSVRVAKNNLKHRILTPFPRTHAQKEKQKYKMIP